MNTEQGNKGAPPTLQLYYIQISYCFIITIILMVELEVEAVGAMIHSGFQWRVFCGLHAVLEAFCTLPILNYRGNTKPSWSLNCMYLA